MIVTALLRIRISLIYSVSNNGSIIFIGVMASSLFVGFIENLFSNAGTKIFISSFVEVLSYSSCSKLAHSLTRRMILNSRFLNKLMHASSSTIFSSRVRVVKEKGKWVFKKSRVVRYISVYSSWRQATSAFIDCTRWGMYSATASSFGVNSWGLGILRARYSSAPWRTFGVRNIDNHIAPKNARRSLCCISLNKCMI